MHGSTRPAHLGATRGVTAALVAGPSDVLADATSATRHSYTVWVPTSVIIFSGTRLGRVASLRRARIHYARLAISRITASDPFRM